MTTVLHWPDKWYDKIWDLYRRFDCHIEFVLETSGTAFTCLRDQFICPKGWSFKTRFTKHMKVKGQGSFYVTLLQWFEIYIWNDRYWSKLMSGMRMVNIPSNITVADEKHFPMSWMYQLPPQNWYHCSTSLASWSKTKFSDTSTILNK